MLVKVYDGVTIDMATSEVISTGKVSYVDSKDVAYTKGGGTSTSTTGFAQEYKPQITEMLNTGKNLYDTGQLGAVAGFTQDQLAAQQAGKNAATNQMGLEQSLMNTANQGVNLSGMRTAAQQQAQSALGLSNATAGRTGNLGGSRQALNQQSVANDLAAKFATIDQQAQQQDFANKQAALGAQGTGAQTLAGIGQAQQQQQQNIADAPYKGLSQYASLFHGVADKSTTTQQSGGK